MNNTSHKTLQILVAAFNGTFLVLILGLVLYGLVVSSMYSDNGEGVGWHLLGITYLVGPFIVLSGLGALICNIVLFPKRDEIRKPIRTLAIVSTVIMGALFVLFYILPSYGLL